MADRRDRVVTRTRASTVILLVLIGGTALGGIEYALRATGNAILVPPVTLPIALAAIGAIVVSMAVPIRRMTRSRVPSPSPVDPLFATRVAMLAKASSLSGALLAGGSVGILVYMSTLAVLPNTFGLAIAAVVGATALLVCGLIAERMCTVPPRDDDDDDDDGAIRVRS